MTRKDGRLEDQAREIKIELGYLKYAEGSCLISAGETKIICAATFQPKVPGFLIGSGQGWITAEYNLLPRATKERTIREAVRGRLRGRTQEIKRLIGRSLRAACDLRLLKENTIIIDCDVIQADGSTRVLSVTGGFCALAQAVDRFVKQGKIEKSPILEAIAGISVGIVRGGLLLDLNYLEDSCASADMNLVLSESDRIVEIQATAEEEPFLMEDFTKMFELGRKEIKKIIELQKRVLSEAGI